MIQNIPEGVDSKFRLVLLIARRAEQLMRGARPKLKLDRAIKPTRLAAEEFEENQIRWDYGEEGGVLEPATDEIEEIEEVMEEEEESVSSRDLMTPSDGRIPSDQPAAPRSARRLRAESPPTRRPEVVRGLPVEQGAEVRVTMTRAAREFVAPLTFAVLSGHDVYPSRCLGALSTPSGRRSRRARRLDPMSSSWPPRPRTRSPGSRTAMPTTF